MAVRNLESMYRRFCRRTDHILTAFQTPLPSNPQDAESCQPVHSAGEVQLLNRLLVLWGEYCRNIVIISAIGRVATINGTLLTPAQGIKNFSDVRNRLGRKAGAGPGTKWDYPDWALQQASTLSPANMSRITTGLTGTQVDSVRIVRNFLVHPNELTKGSYLTLARNLGYVQIEPKDLLIEYDSAGNRLLELWINQFQISAYEAAL